MVWDIIIETIVNYPRLNPIGEGLNPHLWNKTHTNQNHFNGLSYDKIKKESGLVRLNSPVLNSTLPLAQKIVKSEI